MAALIHKSSSADMKAIGHHTFDEEEKAAFSEHINNTLANDPLLVRHLPLNVNSNDLFEKSSDGLIFCKLINLAVRDAIDERALNTKENINIYQKTENCNLALNAAKSIGCQVINIGAQDLIEGRPILILGLVWQIIKIQLLSQISLSNFPELVLLLEEDETMAALMRLHPELILLRWLNFHLRRGGSTRKVTNFGTDLADSEVFNTLLFQLSSAAGPYVKGPTDPMHLAENVIKRAKNIGVNVFLQPKDICNANKKLLVSFCAQVFNTLHGLKIEEDAKGPPLDLSTIEINDAGDTREERSFRMWMNSLNIEGLYVDNVFNDIESGVALLQVMDKILPPGAVSPKRINRDPKSRYKKIENANYVIELCKQMKFTIVNVGGLDIVDGNHKMILAIIWQMMRRYTFSVLEGLAAHEGLSDISDDRIVAWANQKVASSGRTSSMKSFKDSSLRNSLFLLDLVSAIEPRAVNWDLVTPGVSPEEQMANARYVISNARKVGATVFLTPEDIVEIKSKMIMTLVSALWSADLQRN